MKFSLKSQIVIVWWSLIFLILYTVALVFLLHIVPPPRATMTSEEVKSWYQSHDTSIKWGAAVCAWTSAFFVPFSVVVAAQIRRHEVGYPIWSQLTLISGGLTATFLVLPPIGFGAAAFNSGRSADATEVLHTFSLMMLVTTDMWYVFMWAAIIVIALKPTKVENPAFPRWFGYLTIFSMSVFEFGVFAYLNRTGPFAWNGVIVWWAVFGVFFAWCLTATWLLLQTLKRQIAELDVHPESDVELELAGAAT